MYTPLSLATSQILISDAGREPIYFNGSRTCIFWSRVWSGVFIKGFWTQDVTLTFQKRPVVQISSCRFSGKLLCSCFRASPNTEPAGVPLQRDMHLQNNEDIELPDWQSLAEMVHGKEQLLQHRGKPHLGLKFPFHLQAEEHPRIINEL